jgi:hypothetical protein
VGQAGKKVFTKLKETYREKLENHKDTPVKASSPAFTRMSLGKQRAQRKRKHLQRDGRCFLLRPRLTLIAEDVEIVDYY